MLALKGIYDGKQVRITDDFSETKKYKVIVTFIEEIDSSDKELRYLTSQTTGIDFWAEPAEDIYQDYLKK